MSVWRNVWVRAEALSLVGSLLVLGSGCSASDEPSSPTGGASGSSAGGTSGVGLLPTGVAGTLPGLGGDGPPDGNSGSGGDGGSTSSHPAAVPERVLAYLTSASFTRLRVEIDAVDGLWPYASSKDYLGRFYAELLDKPDGIVFVEDETLEPTGNDVAWSIDDLDALARAHASAEQAGTISIQVLALHGHYAAEDGGTVLGVAWGQRFIALFQDALRSNCEGGLFGGLEQDACEAAERNVWAHEMGHVIGLVDNGVPMQTDHRDAEHGRHDSNEGCLMYWAYDRPEIFDTLFDRLGSGEGSDLDLCAQSRADVEAVRSR
jgi:hypothetical protein